MHGTGKFIWADGVEYEGNFLSGKVIFCALLTEIFTQDIFRLPFSAKTNLPTLRNLIFRITDGGNWFISLARWKQLRWLVTQKSKKSTFKITIASKENVKLLLDLFYDFQISAMYKRGQVNHVVDHYYCSDIVCRNKIITETLNISANYAISHS